MNDGQENFSKLKWFSYARVDDVRPRVRQRMGLGLRLLLAGGLSVAALQKIPAAFDGRVSVAWGWAGAAEIALAVPLLVRRWQMQGLAVLQSVIIGSGVATSVAMILKGPGGTCKCIGPQAITHSQALILQGAALALCIAARALSRGEESPVPASEGLETRVRRVKS